MPRVARATRPLIPILIEQRAGAAVIGAVALMLLLIPPFVADGEQILFWSDLALVPVAVLAAVWLRRQRGRPVAAPPLPAEAVLASDQRVLRRQAGWAVAYLLFVLLVATSVPDFFGFGFACAVLAVALALEARHLARWEQRVGARLYRGRTRGWFKRDNIYRVEDGSAVPQQYPSEEQ
jgi:hypothetical protein